MRNLAGGIPTPVRFTQSTLHSARLCFFPATSQPTTSDGCHGTRLLGSSWSNSNRTGALGSCSPKGGGWKRSQTRAQGGTTPSGSMSLRTPTWGGIFVCRDTSVIRWSWVPQQVRDFCVWGSSGDVFWAAVCEREDALPLPLHGQKTHKHESGQANVLEFPV